MSPEYTPTPSSSQPQQTPIISPIQPTPLGQPREGVVNRFCHIGRRITFPMAIILPLWLIFGAAGGWLTLLFMFILSPALFVILLVFHFLISGRADVVANKRLSSTDAVTLTVLYVSIFMYGFFVVNGGDTTDSINSDAMKLFGRSFENTSQHLSDIFLVFSVILIVLAFILFLYERFAKPIR